MVILCHKGAASHNVFRHTHIHTCTYVYVQHALPQPQSRTITFKCRATKSTNKLFYLANNTSTKFRKLLDKQLLVVVIVADT